jgi:hypothetical protein
MKSSFPLNLNFLEVLPLPRKLYENLINNFCFKIFNFSQVLWVVEQEYMQVTQNIAVFQILYVLLV